ncbi:long-chain fatty acid--CoA ligase [Kyrpidia tusciae]|uniref:AMP-dependent synthetase and ligase n=1 Tax=Kyrpidia tusciae (strain DSM 2912 / NBRC 15312 / T2) TaxID=562970 RepID=D5WWF9_KYRT2|nr:long-chain fatty acid--CoA ligase [Kyrpidia tusciae]ADG07724.1 AMP-dependent synthetase and ligase [Kyrpidia tusciae DSM 2912]
MNGTMMNTPLVLPSLLERAGTFYGKVEVVSRLPDRSLHRYRYADFYRRAKQLAEALQKAGLRRGDRVATLMWNHYAHLEAYFGIPAAGGVLHTVNLRLHPDDIAFIMNHAEDRFLIIDDVLVPLYEQVKGRVNLERVFVVSLTDAPVSSEYEKYEDLLATATGDFHYPNLGENEAAGMCYTSGTTGRPKGVVYSHRALVLHSLASAMADTLALSQRDTATPVVPMFHANAWGVPFAAVLVGAKLVFPGPHLDPVSLLDLFEAERVTLSAGVPTIWLGIVQALEKEPDRWKLQPMRMAVGGSAAPEGLIRAFDRFGLRIVHAWGMTETTPLATVSYIKSTLDDLPEDEKYALRAKQGLTVPLIEARIVGDRGEAPWDGQTMGELQVRGPWVAASYYQMPNNDSFTPDGWFRTGDVATIDPEGYMKITDRTKDLIKSGGEWISSVDLENALMGHPAVAEAAVFAVPHPKWQERPLAAVVPKAGIQVTEEELRAYLESKFAKWWLPDAVVFLEEIPRTSAGKFMKAKLREQFKNWNDEQAPGSPHS